MAAPAPSDLITSSTPVAISFMVSVVVMKVTAFILGFLIVRLGHDTLVRGISGDTEFDFGGNGLTAKLRAASPGVFFVLMGSAIILWGLWVRKPMSISTTPGESGVEPVVEMVDDPADMRRVEVPD